MPPRRLCGAQKEGERGSSRVESPQSGGEAASDGHVAPTQLRRTYIRSHTIENSESIIASKQVLQGRKVHTRLRTRGSSQEVRKASPHFEEYKNSSRQTYDKKTPFSLKAYEIQNLSSLMLREPGPKVLASGFKYCV